MGKRILIISMVFILFVTTGCWDRQEIEERVYAFGIAFDKAELEALKDQGQAAQGEFYNPHFNVTYIYPLPSVLIGKGIGEDTFITKSTISSTPREAERDISARTDQELFLGHTNLILLGEDILKDPRDVKIIMDYLHRNQELNWNANIGVVEGKAKDAFNIKPKGVTRLVNYIVGIMENKSETSRVSQVNLKQMLTESQNIGTFTLPKINLAKDEIKIEGAALVKNFTFAGYFSALEARSLMFLKGTIKGGGVQVNYEDAPIPYTIVNASVKQKLNTTEEGLQMVFTIETEGQLEEGIYGMELHDDKVIKEIEGLVEKQIEKQTLQTIEKLQKDYKVDVIRIGGYIKKRHPKIWKQIEPDWEEVFPAMDIRVEADVYIRRVGVIK